MRIFATGGGTMRGCGGRSGLGVGLRSAKHAKICLCAGYLRAWYLRAWPLPQDVATWQAPQCRGLATAMYATFFFSLSFSFSLSLFFCCFRWEMGGWAATDCPDGQSELYNIYIYFFFGSFLRCLGSSYWTGAWKTSWENLLVLSPHWGEHSVSTMKQHKKVRAVRWSFDAWTGASSTGEVLLCTGATRVNADWKLRWREECCNALETTRVDEGKRVLLGTGRVDVKGSTERGMPRCDAGWKSGCEG